MFCKDTCNVVLSPPPPPPAVGGSSQSRLTEYLGIPSLTAPSPGRQSAASPSPGRSWHTVSHSPPPGQSAASPSPGRSWHTVSHSPPPPRPGSRRLLPVRVGAGSVDGAGGGPEARISRRSEGALLCPRRHRSQHDIPGKHRGAYFMTGTLRLAAAAFLRFFSRVHDRDVARR